MTGLCIRPDPVYNTVRKRKRGEIGMKRVCRIGMALVLLLAALTVFAASAEEAPDISGRCTLKTGAAAWDTSRLVDGDYAKYWQSGKLHEPWLEIISPEPVHTLYICFREIPESYELQRNENGEWVTLAPGDTRFHHVCYDLDGETDIRIVSTDPERNRLVISELFAFGAGDVPGWVQRWEETPEKADLLLLAAHPDDELIFFGGVIPLYDTEMRKRVVVAYLTCDDAVRRAEALNGLWTLGVRTYPVFGPFPDKYSDSLKKAYQQVTRKYVLSWVTALFRRYRPEVVVTHDPAGEYGHGQHRMAADVCIACFDLAADPESDPESAALYGPWEVRKLYLHRWGDPADRLHFDWNTPLESLGGKTGLEIAAEAFSCHVSQAGLHFRLGGVSELLRVETTGVYYENGDFGLYATRVGPDVVKNDFLENIPPDE